VDKKSPAFRLLPLCEEKKRLRSLYQLADKRHSSAVNDVLRVRSKVSKEEYDRVRARVDEARNARNLARLTLEQHKNEHGC
jgi:phage/plasmid-associated DNA primase